MVEEDEKPKHYYIKTCTNTRFDFELTRTLTRRDRKRMASENPLERSDTSLTQAVNEEEEIHAPLRRRCFWTAARGEREE